MAAPDMQIAAQHMSAVRMSAAATLAGALMTASGRPHSVDEAVKLTRDVFLSIWPEPNTGSYQQWKKDFKGDQKHV